MSHEEAERELARRRDGWIKAASQAELERLYDSTRIALGLAPGEQPTPEQLATFNRGGGHPAATAEYGRLRTKFERRAEMDGTPPKRPKRVRRAAFKRFLRANAPDPSLRREVDEYEFVDAEIVEEHELVAREQLALPAGPKTALDHWKQGAGGGRGEPISPRAWTSKR